MQLSMLYHEGQAAAAAILENKRADIHTIGKNCLYSIYPNH